MSIGIDLLAALVHEGDAELFKQLTRPDRFFGPEKELFSYISKHVEKYSTMPKKETVMEQFTVLPVPAEPVKFYADQVEERFQHKALNSMLIECSDLMKSQDPWTAQAVINDTLGVLQAGSHSTGRRLGHYVVRADELLKLDIPPIEMIVDPFLPSRSLAMVFAPRGVGKSWFSLELALSVAGGKDFFAWSVPKAQPVLYIDGEMPQVVLKNRVFTLNHNPPANLTVLSSEALWRDGRPLNLNLPEEQARADQLLASLPKPEKPALIILDNLSALCAGIDENSNTDQDDFLRWLVKLRSQGYAVLLVHHAGKNGQQRGASRREDLLDTSIKLSETPPTHGGAAFDITFTKIRGKKPNPFTLGVELDTSGIGTKWHLDTPAVIPAWKEPLRVIRDEAPKTQKELAATLKLSQSTLSEHLTKARKAGMLHADKLELTALGMAEIEKIWPKEIVDALG